MVSFPVEPCPACPEGWRVNGDEYCTDCYRGKIDMLEKALQFIADGYANHNINHVDYRVKVYQVALDALERVSGSVGSAREGS